MKHNTVIKKVLTAALAATLTFTTLAIPASATWQTTDNGKQWVETDGTVAKSKWIKMKSGDRYYIKSNGSAATGLLTLTETVNGKKTKTIYYFDKDGKMQTGWQYVNKNYYYFNTKTGKAYTGTKTIGNYKFKFDGKGIWNGKVYNSKGKDVTANTDIEKITGIKTSNKTTATVTKNPDTITIAGTEYSTKLTTLTLNQANLTDEDLEPLKYMTKLKQLYIIPGTSRTGDKAGGETSFWDYNNIKYTGTYQGKYSDMTFYTYEGTRTVRSTSIDITNIDFCKYMPKLETIMIAYAHKLTDLTGLQSLHKLTQVFLFNCTGLKNLHDLDTVDFVYIDDISCVSVIFTDNVTYAFNDFYFGERLPKLSSKSYKVVAATTACATSTSALQHKYDANIDAAEDLYLRPTVSEWYNPDWVLRSVVYDENGLLKDYTA